jgi:hypothetical protein
MRQSHWQSKHWKILLFSTFSRIARASATLTEARDTFGPGTRRWPRDEAVVAGYFCR